MKIGTLSLRVSRPIWEIEERFQELLGMLKRHPRAFDEIALFTSCTHPPLPLNEIKQIARNAARVIPILKSQGYSCGINMLSTFGHHEENLEYSLDEPWQRMMDINGNITRGVYCPTDPGLQGYITECYIALADANPDFIWMDDDIRLKGHLPINQCCFCDSCLDVFSEETGQIWTRKSLKEAFDSEDKNEALKIRKAWLQHNRELIKRVMTIARNAVDKSKPGLPLGLMCGECYYNGYAYEEWLEELSKGADRPAMLRPGGGFYTDEAPTAMFQKAHSLGRQIAPLGKNIVDIQSEIECFPYARLAKSLKITLTEAAAYIASGCTGTAFNIMGSLGAPIGEYEPFLSEIEKYRNFLELTSDAFGRSECEGVFQLAGKNSFAAENLPGEWFSNEKLIPPLGHTVPMSTVGIPLAYSKSAASTTFISGRMPLAFSDEEIEKTLSSGVMMDGSALECLLEMGFGDLLGFKIIGKREDDTVEELTDDPINNGFTGWHRDCRQSFKWWTETAYLLEPTDSTARVTGKAVDFALKDIAPVSGMFENKLGGKISIFGYFPWSFTGSLVRSTQLKRTAVWTSSTNLPGYVASYHKAGLWCRQNNSGARTAFILNASFDDAIDMQICLKDAPESMHLYMPFGEPIKLTGSKNSEGYTVFTISDFPAWEMGLLKP